MQIMKLTPFTICTLQKLSAVSGYSPQAIAEKLVRDELKRRCDASNLDGEAIAQAWRTDLPIDLANVVVMDPDGYAVRSEVREACGLRPRAIAKALREAGAYDCNIHRDGRTHRGWRGVRLREPV
jgi:hypothetical protein